MPEPTRSLINDIRSSGPSRRVGGGRSNVSGRYPSRKMGVTIQFESHRVELAGIYEMEHDAAVLEYFDQPPSIQLDYESAAGKRMGVLHTPDFFVIRKGEAGWEEWKTEEDLRRLNTHNPNRYSAQKDGQWHCPPGMAYAERLGLYYRVRSSAEIDWVFQRNIQFLDDYLRCGQSSFEPTIRKAVRDCVVVEPVTSLPEFCAALVSRLPERKLFFHEQVCIVLHRALSEEPAPSMEGVAQRVGRSAAHLRTIHADLCRAITARYTEHKNVQAARRRMEFQEQIHRAVIQLCEHGITPSRQRVLASIPNPVMKSTFILDRQIAVAVGNLQR